MTINLFGREAVFGSATRTHRRRRRPAGHPDPRLRPDHRRRVPSRLHVAGSLGLAQHARPLRRDQDRPDRDAGRPHHGVLQGHRLPLRVRPGRPRGLPRRLRRRRRSRSDVRMNGVFLKEGEQVGVIDPETGRRPSTCSRTSGSSTPTEIEQQGHRRPTRTGRSSRRSRSTRDEHEQRYGRFPKTLIFAANDLPHTSHADQLVDTAATSSAAATGSCRRSRARWTGPSSGSASSATGRSPGSSSPSTCSRPAWTSPTWSSSSSSGR